MDQDKLAAIIAKAGDEGWTDLDLSYKRLRSLPPEIGNLTALTTLNLHGNKLTKLPSEIGNLTSLTRLYLSDNQVTA
ncbi:MAG: leucine-rich repeat domain-containing protein, partial [Dehalococcoidia bacterium]|nr:leucine-rich repeat domain-containing protein [Dehalococcoidia bacterium]